MSVFAAGEGAQPVVVGHRGAPELATENTPASFAAAAAVGARWVELDARRSADGVVVVNHDPCTPDGVPLVTQDAAVLASRGVPALADVLASLPPGLGVDVELKNLPGEPDHDEDQVLAGLVAGVLTPHSGRRPLAVTSFNPLAAVAVTAALPAVPAGLVHGAGLRLSAGISIASEFGLRLVCPHVDARGIDAAVVAGAHAAGLEVMVWTVNDVRRASELAALGVDALCTDVPDVIAAALARGPDPGCVIPEGTGPCQPSA